MPQIETKNEKVRELAGLQMTASADTAVYASLAKALLRMSCGWATEVFAREPTKPLGRTSTRPSF